MVDQSMFSGLQPQQPPAASWDPQAGLAKLQQPAVIASALSFLQNVVRPNAPGENAFSKTLGAGLQGMGTYGVINAAQQKQLLDQIELNMKQQRLGLEGRQVDLQGEDLALKREKEARDAKTQKETLALETADTKSKIDERSQNIARSAAMIDNLTADNARADRLVNAQVRQADATAERQKAAVQTDRAQIEELKHKNKLEEMAIKAAQDEGVLMTSALYKAAQQMFNEWTFNHGEGTTPSIEDVKNLVRTYKQVQDQLAAYKNVPGASVSGNAGTSPPSTPSRIKVDAQGNVIP